MSHLFSKKTAPFTLPWYVCLALLLFTPIASSAQLISITPPPPANVTPTTGITTIIPIKNGDTGTTINHDPRLVIPVGVPTSVTQDGRARLVVIKHVINDNGGTKTAADFTLQVTATTQEQPIFQGAEDPGHAILVTPGNYSVDEIGARMGM